MIAMFWLNKPSRSKQWGLQSRLWKDIGEIKHLDHGGGRRFPGGDKTKPELEWVKDGEDLARQRKPK